MLLKNAKSRSSKRSSKHQRASLRQKASHRLLLERLEDRLLLTLRFWTGAGADGLWSNAANWTGGALPMADDNLVFTAFNADTGALLSTADKAMVNDFADGTRFRSITISDGGYNLSGNSITLMDGFVYNDVLADTAGAGGDASGIATIALDGLLLNGPQTIAAANAGTRLVLNTAVNTNDSPSIYVTFDGSGRIDANQSISGQANLRKDGAGELRLNAENSFGGVFFINAGEVRISTDTALGGLNAATAYGSTYINIGGALVLDAPGGISVAETISVRGYASQQGWEAGASEYGGALRSESGDNTITGDLVNYHATNSTTGLNATTPFNTYNIVGVSAGSTLRVGRVIAPEIFGTVGTSSAAASFGNFANHLVKVGGGVLEFYGNQSNTYTGDTHVLHGTLRLNKTAGQSILGNIYVGSFADRLYGNDSAVLEIASDHQQIPIVTAAQFTVPYVEVRSTGKIVLNDNVDQQIGEVRLYVGQSASGDIQTYSNDANNAGTLTLQGNVFVSNYTGSSYLSPAATIKGKLDLGTQFSGNYSTAVTTGTQTRRIDVADTYNPGKGLDLDLGEAVISGGSHISLYKSGAGAIRFGTNAYTGDTILNTGLYELTADNPFGTTGRVVVTGGTVTFRAMTDNVVVANDLMLENTIIFDGPIEHNLPAPAGLEQGDATQMTFTGKVYMSGSRSFVVLDPFQTVTFTGVVTDELWPMSGITKAGRGKLEFTNTILNSGSIVVQQDGGTLVLKDNATITNARIVEIQAGGDLVLDNSNIYNANRIHDNVELRFTGGKLIYKGHADQANTPTWGMVHVYSEYDAVIESHVAANSSNIITIGNLNLGGTGQLKVYSVGENVGSANSKIVLRSQPTYPNTTLPNLSAPVNGVMSWVIMKDTAGRLDYATLVDHPQGFELVPVAPADYVNVASQAQWDAAVAAGTLNTTSTVRIAAGTTVTTDTRTIYALVLEDGAVLNGKGPGTTLSLGSTVGVSGIIMGNGAAINVGYLTFLATANVYASDQNGDVVTINSVIGGGTWQKGGRGDLVLTGANEFTGVLYIHAGSVTVEHDMALGTSAGVTRVYSGAELRLRDPSGNNTNPVQIYNETLQLYGAGITDAQGRYQGVLRNLAGQNYNTGNVTLNSTSLINGYDITPSNGDWYTTTQHLAVDAGSSLKLSGLMSGGVNLTKIGQGTLELNGTSVNTHTGHMRVKEGTLQLNKPAGAVAMSYGDYALYVGDEDASNGNATVEWLQNDQIYDTIVVRAASDAILDFHGHNELLGEVNLAIGDGTASQVMISENMGGADGLLIQNTNNVNIHTLGGDANGTVVIDGGTWSLGSIRGGAANREWRVNDGLAAIDLLITSAIVDGTGFGAQALYKYGLGTMQIGGDRDNTFTGLMYTAEGTTELNKTPGARAFSGNIYVGDGGLSNGFGMGVDVVKVLADNQMPDYYSYIEVRGTGLLDFQGHSESVGLNSYQNALKLETGARMNIGAGGMLTVNGNVLFRDGATNLPGKISGGTIDMGNVAPRTWNIESDTPYWYDLYVDSTIAGGANATVLKVNNGGLLLTGDNTFTGEIYAQAGLVGLGHDNALGLGNARLSLGAVVLASENGAHTISRPTFFDNTLNVQLYGDITFANQGTLTAGRTFIVQNPIFVTLAGQVGEMNGPASFAKSGFGFLNIAAPLLTSSTFTLSTAGGTVILSDEGRIVNATTITVGPGGTLMLLNGHGGANLADRIDDRIPISLNKGSLIFVADEAAASTEKLGLVYIGSGGNAYQGQIGSFVGSDPASTARLTIDRLLPNAGAAYAQVQFLEQGADIGTARNQILVSPGNAPAGGSIAGANAVLGWGFISNLDNGETDFLAYDETVGFKAAPYQVGFAGANTTTNVKLTASEAIAANTTVNALMLVGGVTVSGGFSLNTSVFLGVNAPTSGNNSYVTTLGANNVVATTTFREGALSESFIYTDRGATTTINAALATDTFTGGKGTLVLNAANTGLSSLVVVDGTVVARHTSALGTGTGTTTIFDGAVVELAAVAGSGDGSAGTPWDWGNKPLSINSSGHGDGNFSRAGGLVVKNGHNVIGTGTTGFSTGSTPVISVAAGSLLNLNGTVTHGAALVKLGEGELRLSGTANNVGAQTITVAQGTLSLNKTGAGIFAHRGNIVIGDDLGGNDADKVVFMGNAQLDPLSRLVINGSGLLNLGSFAQELAPTSTGYVLTLNMGPSGAGDIVMDPAGTLTLTNGANIAANVFVGTSAYSVQGTTLPFAGNAGAKISGGQLLLKNNATSGQTMLGIALQVENGAAADDFEIASKVADVVSANPAVDLYKFTGDAGGALNALGSLGVTAGGVVSGSAGITQRATVSWSRLVLSGDNTFGGKLTIGGGELWVRHANALGGTAGATFVTDTTWAHSTGTGTSLVLDGTAVGDMTLAEQISLLGVSGRGVGLNDTGILRNFAGNNTLNGNISLNASGGTTTTIGVDAGTTLTINGGILSTNAGTSLNNLIKNLDGTLELGGSVGNTFIGSTTVNQGTLILNKTAGFALNATTNSQGTLAVGNHHGGLASDKVVFGSAATNEQINSNMKLLVSGSGRFDTNGKNQTFRPLNSSGADDANIVAIQVYIGNTSTEIDSGTGTINLHGGKILLSGAPGAVYGYFSPSAKISGNLNLGGHARQVQFDVPDGATYNDLEISANITGTSTGGVLKTNTGTVLLSGNNATFASGWQVRSSGQLAWDNDNALGTGTINLNDGYLRPDSPGTFAAGTRTTRVVANPVTLTSSSRIYGLNSVDFDGAWTVAASSTLVVWNYGTVQIDGQVTINNTFTFSPENFLPSTFVINGKITDGTGVGHLNKSGGNTSIGTLTLTNNTNDYDGQTTVALGKLRITAPNALGATHYHGYSTVAAGAVLELAIDPVLYPAATINEVFHVGQNGGQSGTSFGISALTWQGGLRLIDTDANNAQTLTLAGDLFLTSGTGTPNGSWIGVDAANDTLLVNGTVRGTEIQTILLSNAPTGSWTLRMLDWDPSVNLTITSTTPGLPTEAELQAHINAAIAIKNGAAQPGLPEGAVTVKRVQLGTTAQYIYYIIYDKAFGGYDIAQLQVTTPGATNTIATPVGGSATYGLAKVGAGILEIAGDSANTLQGPTWLNEGTLRLNKPNSSGTHSNLALGNGVLFVGDHGGGNDADLLEIVGDEGDQLVDNALIVVSQSGKFQMSNGATDTVGSLVLFQGTTSSADIDTGIGTLVLTGGTNFNTPITSVGMISTQSYGLTKNGAPAARIAGSLDIQAPVPTITANDTLYAGASEDLVIDANVTTPAVGGYVNGLREHRLGPNIYTSDSALWANQGLGAQAYPRYAYTAVPGSTETWSYVGQVWDDDGVFGFAENIDDLAYVWIDSYNAAGVKTPLYDAAGQSTVAARRIHSGIDGSWVSTTYDGTRAFNNTTSTTAVSGVTPSSDYDLDANNTSGRWHDIEIRFLNGGGSGGASSGRLNWFTSKGFGYNEDALPASTGAGWTTAFNGNSYIIPYSTGMSLFRTAVSPLTSNGLGTVSFTAAAAAQLDVRVVAGTMKLADDNGAMASVGKFVVESGATLALDNTDGVNTDRISDTAVVELAGGTLKMVGNSVAAGNNAATETIGDLVLQKDKASQVVVASYEAATTLTANQQTYIGGTTHHGASLVASGANAADGSFAAAYDLGAGLNSLVIAADMSAQYDDGILPYAVVRGSAGYDLAGDADGNNVNGGEIVAYTGYVTDLSVATASDNVKLTGGTHAVTGVVNVNALVLEGGAVVNLGDNDDLVVNAGLIVAEGANNQINEPAGGNQGQLNVTASTIATAGFLFTGEGASLDISAKVVTTDALRKEGDGTLVFTADNNAGGTGIQGLITVGGGLLYADNAGALGNGGSAATATAVNSGAQLQLGAHTYVNEQFNLAGTGYKNNATGALRLATGTAALGSGANATLITLLAPTSGMAVAIGVEQGADLTINGAIQDQAAPKYAPPLWKTGKGELILSGTTANTYAGNTTLVEGTLTLNKGANVVAIGANTRVYVGDTDGGELLRYGSASFTNQLDNTVSVTVNRGATFELSKSGRVAQLQVIDGTVNLNGVSGATLSNSGTTTMQGGVMNLSPGVIYNIGNTVYGRSNGQAQILGGRINLNGNARVFSVQDGAAMLDMVVTADMNFTGVQGIGKEDAGTLYLSGNNTFLGRNEHQRVGLGAATSFTLTFNGQTTATILKGADENITAANIDAALEQLPAIGGNDVSGNNVHVTRVTAGNNTLFNVEFQNELGKLDVYELYSATSGVTTATTSTTGLSEMYVNGGILAVEDQAALGGNNVTINVPATGTIATGVWAMGGNVEIERLSFALSHTRASAGTHSFTFGARRDIPGAYDANGNVYDVTVRNGMVVQGNRDRGANATAGAMIINLIVDDPTVGSFLSPNSTMTSVAIPGRVLSGGPSVVHLQKQGLGGLYLGGDNTFYGSTSVQAGYLTIGHSNALGVSGFAPPTGVTINLGSALAFIPNPTVTVDGLAVLRLDGSAHPEVGINTDRDVDVVGKTLVLRAPNAAASATAAWPKHVSGYLNDSDPNGVVRSLAGNNSWNGRVETRALDTTGRQFFIGVDSGSTLEIWGEIASTDATGMSILGNGISKVGLGTLVYAGAVPNSYWGPTEVFDGTLRLAKDSTAVLGDLWIGDAYWGGNSFDTVEVARAEQIRDTTTQIMAKTGKLRLLDSMGAANEEQTLTFSTVPTTGTYKLEFNGVQTAALNWDATATQMAAALNDLASVKNVGGAVTVVAGVAPNSYVIEFTGRLGRSDQSLVTFVNVDSDGAAAAVETVKGGTRTGGVTSEVQEVGFSTIPTTHTSGSWTISFGGYTTQALAPYASAAQVEAALNALPSIRAGGGSVAVSGGRTAATANGQIMLGSFYVWFQNGWAGQDVAPLTMSATGIQGATLVGGGTAVEVQKGGQTNVQATTANSTDIQTINFRDSTTFDGGNSVSATQGTWTITYTRPDTGAKITTAAIVATSATTTTASGVSAAQVEAALNKALNDAGVSGIVRVAGDRHTFVVSFLGEMSGKDQVNLAATNTSLSPTVAGIQIGERGRGGQRAVETVNVSSAMLGTNVSSGISIAEGAMLALNSHLTVNVFAGDNLGGADSTMNIHGPGTLGLSTNLIGGTAATSRVITVADGPADVGLYITAVIDDGPSGIVTHFDRRALSSIPSARVVLDPMGGMNTYSGFTTLTSGTTQIRTSQALGGNALTGIGAAARTNEVRKIAFASQPTAGQTWTITFTNPFTTVAATTVAIAGNSSVAEVETALNALTNLNGGRFRVNTTDNAYTYSVSFMDGLGGIDIADANFTAASTGPAVTVSTYIQGGAINGTTVASGHQLELAGIAGDLNLVDEQVTVSGYGYSTVGSINNVNTLYGLGALRNLAGNNTITQQTLAGTVNLVTTAGWSSIHVDDGTSLNIAGVLRQNNDSALIKTGLGTLETSSVAGLTGGSNNSQGNAGTPWYVWQGTLLLNKAAGETANATGTTIVIGDGRGSDRDRLVYGTAAGMTSSLADGATLIVNGTGEFDFGSTVTNTDRIGRIYIGLDGGASGIINTRGAELELNVNSVNGIDVFHSGFVTAAAAPAEIAGRLHVNSGGAADVATSGGAFTRRIFRVAESDAAVGLHLSANLRNQFAVPEGIELTGGGVLKLSGDNALYQGETWVSEGTLIVASANALGDAGGTQNYTTVEEGGQLVFENVAYTAAEKVFLASTGYGAQTSGLVARGGNSSFAGSIEVNKATAITAEAGSKLSVDGAVTLNADLSVGGAGDVDLLGVVSGLAGYGEGLLGGRLSVNAGTAALDFSANPGNLGAMTASNAGPLHSNSSAAGWGDYTTVVYTGQVFDADGVFSFAENIDDHVIIKIGGRIFDWNTGSSTVTSTGNGSANAWFSAQGQVANAVYNDPDGDHWYDIEIRGYNGTGGAGGVLGTGFTTSYGVSFNPTTNNVAGNGAAPFTRALETVDGTPTLFRYAVSSNLRKIGTGTVTLGGAAANTYAGSTTVEAGTLVIAKDAALGAATAGTAVDSGATLAISGGVTYAATEAVTLANNATLENRAGNNSFAGTVTSADANGGATVASNDANGTLLLNGAVTLTGDLTFTGAGNTGVVGQIDGAGDLIKTGAGGLGLANANNGYTGATTVSAGTLALIDGSTGTGNVAIDGGSLIGAGTVKGELTVASGASVAPGGYTADAGTITLAANATFAAGSNLLMQVGGTTAGTSDQIVVGAGTTADLSGANLAVSTITGYTATATDRQILVDVQGAATTPFANIGEAGLAVTQAPLSGRINYTGGTGDDVRLVWQDDTAAKAIGTLLHRNGANDDMEAVHLKVQRSVISQLYIVFAGLVSDLESVLAVERFGNAHATEIVGATLTPTTVGDHTEVLVEFAAGANTIARTGGDFQLRDGNYRVKVDGNTVDSFFRLFGDSDGDRDVDNRDQERIAALLAGSTSITRTQYLYAFDYNGENDGTYNRVSNNDYSAFRPQRAKVLSATQW